MPIQFDKFDQQKIDRLKNHLETQAQKGHAKFYEIYVDSLKAVPKTDEPSEFEDYENYMTADTYQVKVVIYNSATSPRNDQYVFSMKASSSQEALDMGLDGITLKMLSKAELSELKSDRDKHLAESISLKELRTEVEELEAELDKKNEYIGILETAIERAKANGNKIGGFDLGHIFGEGIAYLVKKNAHVLAGIPGLDGIASMIGQNPNDQEQPAETTSESNKASFTKKATESTTEQPTNTLSEEESQFLLLFKNIRKVFSDEEIFDLLEVIDRLSRDKEKLPEVMDFLKKDQAQ